MQSSRGPVEVVALCSQDSLLMLILILILIVDVDTDVNFSCFRNWILLASL